MSEALFSSLTTGIAQRDVRSSILFSDDWFSDGWSSTNGRPYYFGLVFNEDTQTVLFVRILRGFFKGALDVI